MPEISEIEVAWLAGLLEGEGNFEFNNYNRSCPRVRVEMTDKDVVDRVASIIGGKPTVRPAKKYQDHHKQSYVYSASGARLIPLLKRMFPYMSNRRRAKLSAIFDQFIDLIGYESHRDTPNFSFHMRKCVDCRRANLEALTALA